MDKRKGLVLGVAGRARVGKDRFTDYLVGALENNHDRLFKTTAFAHRLKQMCLEHFNLNREQLWGNDKEEPTKFSKSPSITDVMGSTNLDINNWTPREIMQELGAFYRRIDRNFWVRKLDENWKYNNCPDTIITDVRHINECEFVKEHGVLIKIVRDDATEIHGMTHESEIALDGKSDDYFDIVINNNGTLDDLQIAARDTAKMVLELEQLKEKRRTV